MKQKLASLLEANADDISLEPMDAGLTHSSYCCYVAENKYYIKVYNNIENIFNVISYINQLTAYMRQRGVPASRLHVYAAAFANIVIHDFVEGEMHAGQFSQIAPIAELYSKVVQVGVDHSKHLSKPEYLSGIRGESERMKTIENQGAANDLAIHAGMLTVTESVLFHLEAHMKDEELFHVHVHDDFTEKNILMEGNEVKLLCDWDSCRLKFFNEYFATTATRFSTERPLSGLLQQEKLTRFLQSVDPEVTRLIPDMEEFASLFPYWATLKHLRTYGFRNSVVNQGRPDLKTPLLAWPYQHCAWLLKNREQVSDWVYGALNSE